MRILIVDDEKPARDKLRRLLAAEAGVTAIDEAADGIEALERIAASEPDALFLDIAMPELSGIELAASLPEPAPAIVFVTAWDQYAIQAFDAGAIDYLLKPYDAARLARAVQRLRERMQSPAPQALPALPLHQLLVSERGATRVVPVLEIGWIESADNYVVLHTPSGSPLLRQTLGGLAERLGPAFLRCHRRAAVQLACIERVVPLDKGDCELVLRGGARVPCSRQYRAAVMERLGIQAT
ncbi:Transcriptional regulatory protein YehT [Massilia sp. Bi118]|uniref:LytR/AlgR family response regulator transcription factor n=1 Tax=Massilia sp. Bi118 TaxID=2822346 RepID=UPI001E0D8CAD|nr:response regulator [Massilia sp. Bi118]CAH0312514.1 Transcriptional regulatory protein YehT [Massilia sp. Bi118]